MAPSAGSWACWKRPGVRAVWRPAACAPAGLVGTSQLPQGRPAAVARPAASMRAAASSAAATHLGRLGVELYQAL